VLENRCAPKQTILAGKGGSSYKVVPRSSPVTDTTAGRAPPAASRATMRSFVGPAQVEAFLQTECLQASVNQPKQALGVAVGPACAVWQSAVTRASLMSRRAAGTASDQTAGCVAVLRCAPAGGFAFSTPVWAALRGELFVARPRDDPLMKGIHHAHSSTRRNRSCCA
jgi:hypothetical protein